MSVSSAMLLGMTLRLSLDLYEMTYGQLFDFVEAARAAGVSRATEVLQVPVENEDNIIDRFEIELTSLPGKARVISAEDAEAHAATLESVIDSEGDARSELSRLQDLRAALLG